MLSLAIETTTSFGSMSLIDNHTVLNTIEWSKAKSHSEVITTNFIELLSASKKNSNDLKQVFIDIGPGSFTGNRIGLNFCAALSYGLNIPIQTKNSLEILAAQLHKHSEDKPIVCMQNAYNQKIYTATYQFKEAKLVELSAPRVAEPKDLLISTESIALGNGLPLYKDLIPQKSLSLLSQLERASDYPESKNLAHLCLNQSSEKIAWNQLEPLYLKASEAEEKLKRGELKKAISGQYS